MTAKSLRWTLAALIAGSPAAMALGLGDIHLHSALNAPLDADIDLIGATADDLANLKAQVASRETFARNGLDWPEFLSTVTLRPVHTSDGRDIIKVHSGAAITEPFVTLLVEIDWPRGKVTHEYTVLLDPPLYTPGQTPAAAAQVAPAQTTADTRDGAIERTTPAAPPAAGTPPPSTAAGAPPAAGSGQSYHVQSGDTLYRIAAHETGSSSPGELRRWMVATYSANPAAFDNNMNLLRAGTVLREPDPSQVAAVSAGAAAAEVHRQYTLWHGAAGTAAGTAADAGRLRLVTPNSPAAPSPGAAAGTATRALQSEVQQLQAQLNESQRLLQLRNADLARLQAQLAGTQKGVGSGGGTPPAAAPATPPVPASAPPAASQAAAGAPAQEAAPGSAAPPAVRHRPHVTPVVVENGTSASDLLKQYWWALAAIVAALLAWIGIRVWRARRQSHFDDSLGHLASSTTITGEREAAFNTQPLVPVRDETFVVEESGPHARPRFEGTAAPAARHVAADPTISAETAVNLDQGDPLAEADFHMAYGLYDQAADLVRLAIQRDPARRDLRLKLLEVFFVWGNKEQFLEAAHQLAGTRDQAAPGEWEKILIMGKQLAPDDPLFSGGAAVSGAAAAGVDLDLAGAESSGIDFDVLGPGSTASAGGVDLDIGTAIGERDATAESAAALATDKNLALHMRPDSDANAVTGSTREMSARSLAGARPSGAGEHGAAEAPTLEHPNLEADGSPTIRQKVETAMRQSGNADQTAELAIDDLGLDLNALDTVDQPGLGGSPDAPTMVAGLDEHSRRLLATAEQPAPEFGRDPSQSPTGSWQFDGAATDTPESPEAATAHDSSATARLSALSEAGLDFDFGGAEAGAAAKSGNGADRSDVDLDVGTATVPDALFGETQRIGNEDLALPELEPVTMSEVGTKLDLARAYMDMGDPEGARNILEEVVTEGSAAQKQEAQRLIESLPG